MKPTKFDVKNGLITIPYGSNPTLSALKTNNLDDLEAFFTFYNKVRQSLAEEKPLYKPCRLNHYNFDLTKQWYVIFYAWNVTTEKLERRRIFEPINRKKTVKARVEIANEIIKKTNAELRSGKVLGKGVHVAPSAKNEIQKLTLSAAIDFFKTEKVKSGRRPNYLRRYDTLKFYVLGYFEKNKSNEILVKDIDESFFESLFDHIRDTSESNRTFNNYRDDASILMNFLNKKAGKKLFNESQNPVKNAVEKMRYVKSRKHAAFSDEQFMQALRMCTDMGYHDVALFLKFIYYTLGRPKEVMALKVKDIDIKNNRILFRGITAKGWIEAYVQIAPGFKTIIENAGIMKNNPEHFVFGIEQQPGPVGHPNDKYFYNKFKKHVLKKLGFLEIERSFSPYSAKHTGAVSLYLATLDLLAVKEQCRHTNVKQTEDYLRDLGLLRKTQPVMNWNSPVL